MSDQTVFFVEGEPRPKQSFRVSRHGHFQPARVRAWQNQVALCAQLAMREAGLYEPIKSTLSAELTFFLGDARRVDGDNLSKAILDGLNGVIFEDDRQVISLIIHKYVCRERQGVLVRIRPNLRPIEASLHQMYALIELARLDLAILIPEEVSA